MSVLRTHAQSLSDDELLAIWRDGDAWDRNGTIPEASELAGFRSYVMAGGLTGGLEMPSPALWLTSFVSEVWRECALRGIAPEVDAPLIGELS